MTDARAETLGETLIEVWRQVLSEGGSTVELGGRTIRVGRTRSQGLRTVEVTYHDVRLEGIEQNPLKPSRWGKLAQEGKKIMQFRLGSRYVGNVCDGVLLRYPAWRTSGLPE